MVVAVALLASPASAPLAAQGGVERGAERPAGWLETNDRLGRTPLDVAITPADRAAARARLRAIERMLMSLPALSRLDGAEVKAQLDWHPLGIRELASGRTVASYALSMSVFMPTRAIDGETGTHLTITVNPSVADIAYESVVLDAGTDIWIEDTRLEDEEAPLHDRQRDVAVYTPYYAFDAKTDLPFVPTMGKVLITPAGLSPWLPVSKELYLRMAIESAEGPDKAALRARIDTLNMTPLDIWLAEAPKRRKEREAQVAAISASMGKAEGEKLRATLEKSEREVTDNLRAAEPRDRSRAREQAAMTSPIDTMRQMLAALSPAERAEPAWLDANQAPQFVPPYPEYQRARRLVRANPAFYRRGSGSPVAARGILVHFEGAGKSRELMKEIRRQLDWKALAALVDPSRPPSTSEVP